MADFFKKILYGFLAIIFSFVWVPLLLLFSVYLFFVFIAIGFKTMIIDISNIFSGKKGFRDPYELLPEEKEAKRILEAQEEAAKNPIPNQPVTQQVNITNNYYGAYPPPSMNNVGGPQGPGYIDANGNYVNNGVPNGGQIPNNQFQKVSNNPYMNNQYMN
ncbi:MAG: hypothetical protein HUJ61_05730, partial [Bacilli bacterium]|nr:hypothetical protein [Bacilli bacterium]